MLAIEELGVVPYAEALALQQAAVQARRAGRCGDRLLLLEHPPVVTLGRRAKPENLLAAPAALSARGIEVHEVSRGGDITYHGPGQLVGYPIVDLAALGRRDLRGWLRSIEQALIDALAGFDICGLRRPGMTGVFVGAPEGDAPRKIASIGVALKGWVSSHGFALNVTMSPAAFRDIVPCGLAGVEMTSLARELGAPAATHAELFKNCTQRVAAAFSRLLA